MEQGLLTLTSQQCQCPSDMIYYSLVFVQESLEILLLENCFLQSLILAIVQAAQKCGYTVYEISPAKKILRMKVASNPTMQYFSNTSISETVFLKQRIYTERPSCNRSLGDYRNAISKNTTSK